ncbi:hypothetical protein B566_EDAN005325 [Ephemera danica]|nr:hypothetical protein B566_EDAN005325 [Ephemera danica]
MASTMKTALTFALLGIAVGYAAVVQNPFEIAYADKIKTEPINFDPQQVQFWLYTRNTRDTPDEMFVGFLNNAPIDFSKTTKYIAHGYTQNGFDAFFVHMKDNFLDAYDYNVIAIDWGPAANGIYTDAQNNAQLTGAVVGDFISYLLTQGGNVKNMHCIGFSLGAHVCGNAGKQHYDDKLMRITGLDPALPLYNYDRPWERLNYTDADFVDVIHTCGGWLGFDSAIGMVDFHPNGGSGQPDCWWDPSGACDHNRAHQYYTESIFISNFTATQCSSYRDWKDGLCNGNPQALMGDPVDFSTRAFLDQAAQNVIAVDWKDPAGGLYNVAQNNAQRAGATVGEFMAYLKSQGGNIKDMHCIGFSLGAHVCGNAGKQHYDDPLMRITGLDPAGPLYSDNRPWERLNFTDADFVDVMHTNAGACDHGRAHEFYTESIVLSVFTATKCISYDNWQNGVCNGNEQTQMGDPTPSTKRLMFMQPSASKMLLWLHWNTLIMKLVLTLGILALVSTGYAANVPESTKQNGEQFQPKVVDPSMVTYWLYTKDTINSPTQMYINNLNGAPFNITKMTKFLVHGASQSAFGDIIPLMKDEYLSTYDYNVISVDWSDPASGTYYAAQNNVQEVGFILGDFMEYLKVSTGFYLGNVHCVGFSLGAHVCGNAGKKHQVWMLGRITGLDPAQTGYSINRPDDRLSLNDADFVDVIHTCGGYIGFDASLGHADFFPNGGTNQPGCALDLTGVCDHMRSHELFTASIRNEQFTSRECSSYRDWKDGACDTRPFAYMGEDCTFFCCCCVVAVQIMKLRVALLVLLGVALVHTTKQDGSKLQPKAVDPLDITYWLYTKANTVTPTQMYDGFLNNAPIDFSKPTKLIVHGHDDNMDKNYIQLMKDNYFKVFDYNIILVNWANPASGTYGNARDRTQECGQYMGHFIEYLGTQGADLNMVHCIGYDLGAHACGNAGKVQTLQRLGRVTGLDPNQNGYKFGDPSDRIDSNDATFVDVIHTNGGNEGFEEALGHADFYPRGGKEQLACGTFGATCNHERSRELFAESIISSGFTGYICTSFNDYMNGLCDYNEEAKMGEPCSPTVAHDSSHIIMKQTVVWLVVLSGIVVSARHLTENYNENPPWILIPTEGGELHLAAFGNPPEPEKTVKQDFDPFIEITFHLFTRSNPTEAVQVYVGNLNNSAYDPLKPTRFIVHGYNSYFFSGGNLAMKDAFLRAEDCNVVGVDWSGPGGGPLYNVCRNNAKPTGDYLGLFYDFLVSVGSTFAALHCVGHSLGAHVCGYSGKAVNGTLGRASGLDPALPLFDLSVPEERLADTDALYVDIIHSCGGYLGFESAIGHADYFPNDGTRIQPGCEPDISEIRSIIKELLIYMVPSLSFTKMKLSLIFAVFFVVVAPAVHGNDYNGKSWMLFPGANGQRGLVLFDSKLPKSRDIADPYNEVEFFLYTRANRVTPTQIHVGNSNLGQFDNAKNTKFIIHGYTGSYVDSWVTQMKNNFLDDEDCNVVAVDWSGPAAGPLYNQARANVQPAGQYVGDLYNFLNSVSKTHCIGHSLGAHVCGFSGKRVGALARITGMDPALPLFSLDAPTERLTSTDANYVDVIHTCGGWLGFGSSIGHADFYPNGGTASQPGCGTDVTGDCSHGRSHEFFSESIGSSAFRARECNSWTAYQNGNCNNNAVGIMGNPSNTNTRGDYYLATNANSPFAQAPAMKFLLLTLALVASIAIVRGGVSRDADGEPTWMHWPDDEGNPRIAILRGPMPEEKIDPTKIHFMLHTRANQNAPVEMFIGNANGAPFDPAKESKFIVHGYNSNGASSWIIEMKDLYLGAQDVNVFIVDWGEISDGLLYNLVQSRTREVGEHIGLFFNYLITSLGTNQANLHCIGHSLGAHACGVGGKTVHAFSQLIGRVTGMDAALPLYGSNNTDETLASGDASYVDAIHTCGGFLGFQAPLGHADYYPNEGVSSQPGCGPVEDVAGSCSHSRSHEFYAESIISNGFVARRCGSWLDFDGGRCDTEPTSLMGEPSDPRISQHPNSVGETKAIDPATDITFYLYTRSNPDTPVQIFVGDLNGSAFDPSKPSKFMIHGYNSGHLNSWIIQFKDAFLRIEDCNAIGVDWSGPASGPLYNVARNNVNETGAYVGVMYDYLASLGADPGAMHCMGHSLGSHVCGFSGKNVVTAPLGRITGLDPALPLFDLDKPDERLNATDANYVDVIHSCGGFLGFLQPIGQADFYPNGGVWSQPGCGVDVSGGCSHERCHEYFLESIESPNFVSRECDTWENYQAGLCDTNAMALMGNPSTPGTQGNFYLATASESPFALGRNLLTKNEVLVDSLCPLRGRQNPVNATEVDIGGIGNSNLSPTKRTKFVVHGFTDNAQSDWMIAIKDEFLKYADYNVILVDYAGLTNDEQRAGTEMAEFYDYLVTQGYSSSHFLCVGFGQGAHVCGFSGKRSLNRLGRICGLDITKADKFVVTDPTTRIDIGDADIVDCLHTDGGGSGMIENVCGLDFYANGGAGNQPDCGIIEPVGICSHKRAQEIFIESISVDQFWGYLCDSDGNFQNGACDANPVAIYSPTFLDAASANGTYYFNTKLLVVSFLASVHAEANFFSYTRANPTTPVEIFKDDMTGSLMDPAKETKFMIHGFTDTANSQWMIDAKDAYLTFADYNVVLVGWTATAASDKLAARDVSALYQFLVSQGYAQSTFHCAGHSLGGHVCGFASKFFFEDSGTKIGRISGLDAAKADQYMVSDPTSRLDATDADVVDCVHTDGGGSGLLASICKLDFYANNGTRTQPGCGPIEIAGICSHNRAKEYFIESINSDRFYSWMCNSWDEFVNGACNSNPMISYGASYMPLTFILLPFLVPQQVLMASRPIAIHHSPVPLHVRLEWRPKEATEHAQDFLTNKDKFLAFADYNVILVGWTALSATDERAAHDLADFYTYLVSQGFDAGTLHCSGHSAGAHVCGFSGKFFTTATSLKLSRISGLDAAKVDQYNVSDPSSRLDIGDADVVDCIHTDGGGSGLLANICKIDFYPNGGTRTQPGCTGVIELSGICSHVRAYVYFVESIGTDQFYSWACDSWDNFLAGACNGNTMISYGPSYMPLDVPAGTYGLKTNSETPFACGNNCP